MQELSYGEFYELVRTNAETGRIESCELIENTVRGKLADGTYFRVNIPQNDPELIPLMRQTVVDFKVKPPQVFWKNLLYSQL